MMDELEQTSRNFTRTHFVACTCCVADRCCCCLRACY